MLKDISVIIIFPFSQKVLQQMLVSLRKLQARISSVIVIQATNITLNKNQVNDWLNDICFITSKNNELAHTLDNIMDQTNNRYVLFLSHTHCLSASVNSEMLQLEQPKTVLTTGYRFRNHAIYLPLLALSKYIKKIGGFTNIHPPFNEAFLPAWLANLDKSSQLTIENLINPSVETRNTTTSAKYMIAQKYQYKKENLTSPSLSVLISNYNMEKYVDIAVASCLLQNMPFDQILIIDDGSTDYSLKKLLQWDRNKQVKLITKKNEGKAKALNTLLPHVTSEFILELDADDWLDPNAVAMIKKHLLELPENSSLLYGNFRRWKQINDEVFFKGIKKGKQIHRPAELLTYSFPLGPRIYRTSTLKSTGGFLINDFENGRLYEDVSTLLQLIKHSKINYSNFTIYNIREHQESITTINRSKWSEYLNHIDL